MPMYAGSSLVQSTSQGPLPHVAEVGDISQKVNVIIRRYKSDETDISLPRNSDLEDALDDILVKVHKQMSSAKPETVNALHIKVSQYRKIGMP